MTKLRIDQAELTLREMRAIEELLGSSLSDAMAKSTADAIAAMVCVVLRRTNPAATMDEAMDYRMGDLEIVTPDDEAAAPNPSGGGNGAPPPTSPEHGESHPLKLSESR
jgi:hypothetical protein